MALILWHDNVRLMWLDVQLFKPWISALFLVGLPSFPTDWSYFWSLAVCGLLFSGWMFHIAWIIFIWFCWNILLYQFFIRIYILPMPTSLLRWWNGVSVVYTFVRCRALEERCGCFVSMVTDWQDSPELWIITKKNI